MVLDLVKETLKDVRKIFIFVLIAFIILSVLVAILFQSQEAFFRDLLERVFAEQGIILNQEGPLQLPSEIEKEIEELDIGGTWSFAKAIFIKNLKATGVAVLFGLIPFLFVPAISLLLNGAIIGGTYLIFRLVPGGSVGAFLVSILPHGIIEIPALVLAISVGLLLCLTITRRIFKTNRVAVGHRLKGILATYLVVILPILVVAALIESFITPQLINMVM